jgi:hypothetical protein
VDEASLRYQSPRLFYLPAWNIASARPASSKRRLARERVISCGLCHAMRPTCRASFASLFPYAACRGFRVASCDTSVTPLRDTSVTPTCLLCYGHPCTSLSRLALAFVRSSTSERTQGLRINALSTLFR